MQQTVEKFYDMMSGIIILLKINTGIKGVIYI